MAWVLMVRTQGETEGHPSMYSCDHRARLRTPREAVEVLLRREGLAHLSAVEKEILRARAEHDPGGVEIPCKFAVEPGVSVYYFVQDGRRDLA